MKKEKMTSIAVSFVMALSAFSIPVGAFAAEADTDGTEGLAGQPPASMQEIESEAPDEEAVAEEPAAEDPVAEEPSEEPAVGSTQEQMPVVEADSAAQKNSASDNTPAKASSEKYRQYLNFYKHYAYDADIDDLNITGGFPDYEYYNEEMLNAGGDESLMITDSDIRSIVITAKVGDKTYTGNVVVTDWETYEFDIKFGKAALGTPVTVTYQMGDATKTDKLVVSKWVHPKYTTKNFTYDGKSHKSTMTIKVGKQTLKKGRDYYVKSAMDGWKRTAPMAASTDSALMTGHLKSIRRELPSRS